MSLLPRRRGSMRSREEPGGILPVPESFPVEQPRWPTAVIFTVVAGMVTWLLAHGYSPTAALGIVAGTGAAAASIASWMAGAPPAAG
jgi:hypothetical protein